MKTPPNAIPPFLVQFLPQAERVLVLAIAASTLIYYINGSVLLLSISLIGLAVVYVLSAQMPMPTHGSEQEQTEHVVGFSELLAYAILPKVFLIGSAVVLVGISFWIKNFPGGNVMLSIGESNLAICTIIYLILAIKGLPHIHRVRPFFYRGVILMLVTGVILALI